MKNHRIYSGGFLKEIFPNGLELLPNTNKLEIARNSVESQRLSVLLD